MFILNSTLYFVIQKDLQKIRFLGLTFGGRYIYPKTLGFLIIWTLVYLALYFPSTYRAYQQNNPRGLLRYWLILASIGMIFGILLISVVGDGDADLAKHLFLIAVLFDFLTIMTLSDILFNRLWQQETEFDSLKLK